MKKIYIYTENNLHIASGSIKSLIRAVCEEIKLRIASLEINFINNETMRELNKRHLNHDSNTDIITFDYSGEGESKDSEIIISVDEAKISSKKYGCTLNEELSRLLIHGLLHLKGFNDLSNHGKTEMRELEDRLLRKFAGFKILN